MRGFAAPPPGKVDTGVVVADTPEVPDVVTGAVAGAPDEPEGAAGETVGVVVDGPEVPPGTVGGAGVGDATLHVALASVIVQPGYSSLCREPLR